ncbi:APC family permease [Wenyingzhuangia sp. 2_MG-2023]|uniref:APC family permease n=1 Tax=Wenyingzhuangia sp. 2_MG-2023 TaxID=3062639 RepID=UPI0026E344D2|nr:APC family permease [Wenyingzhuangia sp. 2_MG-2023]MDO6737274.1 APC family permease [Wenyingzhuangia sp. 2_MG-2023]
MIETKEHLKREVGVLGLSANIVNIVVGAGIFTLPAIVAAGLGTSSIFAYLFCGVLVTLVMLCFAEVGSKLTDSGGAYTYIRTAFGPYFGFITVILFILSTISADAAVANAVVDVLGSVVPEFKLKWVKILTFVLFFSGFGYINIRGVKEGMAVVKLITIAKLIPLLLLVFFSWGNVSIANLSITSTASFTEVGKMSLILFFAFQGAESGLSIGGEVRNPQKTIPKAIFISILGILILYILIQTVSLGVLGTSLATFKENPLAIVAQHVFGPAGFVLMTIGAAISMTGYLSSSILSMPRILFRAAKDEVLPVKAFTKIHSKFYIPHISIIVYATMGFLFASLGGFEQLAIISSATILLVYLGVSLSVIKLRKDKTKSTTNKTEFKIPGGWLIPILSCVIILCLLSNLAMSEFVGIGMFVAILTIVYFVKKGKADRS